jgi:integrase
MKKAMERIEAEIAAGTFDYAKAFPGSKRIRSLSATAVTVAPRAAALPRHSSLPRFDEFSRQWFVEHSLEWRHTHKLAVESIFKTHLMPAFGELHLGQIRRPPAFSSGRV